MSTKTEKDKLNYQIIDNKKIKVDYENSEVILPIINKDFWIYYFHKTATYFILFFFLFIFFILQFLKIKLHYHISITFELIFMMFFYSILIFLIVFFKSPNIRNSFLILMFKFFSFVILLTAIHENLYRLIYHTYSNTANWIFWIHTIMFFVLVAILFWYIWDFFTTKDEKNKLNNKYLTSTEKEKIKLNIFNRRVALVVWMIIWIFLLARTSIWFNWWIISIWMIFWMIIWLMLVYFIFIIWLLFLNKGILSILDKINKKWNILLHIIWNILIFFYIKNILFISSFTYYILNEKVWNKFYIDLLKLNKEISIFKKFEDNYKKIKVLSKLF